MSFKVRFTGLDARLSSGLAALAPSLGLELTGAGAAEIRAVKGDKLSLTRTGGAIEITYVREHQFFRMLSYLPGALAGGGDIVESPNFGMLCYMADMSRNAVYNIPAAKRMLRYLALMGYDSLMLYTEDTFELPDYPYFGHMRGRFSKAELREIDDYAYDLGIEVIPCVQTLAHLSTALRWPGFGFQDTGDILLVGDERTYKFIDAILCVCAECFRSRRINVGMDEAHMLGRGKYLTQNGYRPSSDVMLEHLERVVGLCAGRGFAPMIWSDMFFRMAFGGKYRVSEGEIAREIIDKVPCGLTLIYWDYHSLDPAVFSHMLDCHKKFHNPVVFAGGAWKWYGFAPHNRFSVESTRMQLDICAEKGIDNIIVTSWGDNGGEASQFSPLSSMIYFAERGYAGGDVPDGRLEERCLECFGIGYEALLTLDAPNELPGVSVAIGRPVNPSRYLLFNDPLEGLLDLHMDAAAAPGSFAESAEKLLKYKDNPDLGYIYDTLGKLCLLLAEKCDVSVRAREAYKKGDRAALFAIAEQKIPVILTLLDEFLTALRAQWYAENKTFGFGVQELRLGGLRARLESTALRLGEYARGEIEAIEELEQPPLPFDGRQINEGELPYISSMSWRNYVTGCVL